METVAIEFGPEIVAGVILSLFLDLTPGVKAFWEGLSGRIKQLYMLLLSLLVGILFVLAPALYTGVWPVGWEWLSEPFWSFVTAYAAMGLTYMNTSRLTGAK